MENKIMEEREIELIDYLGVIWKQKILILVGTLVCIIIGTVMSLKLPAIYHAKALIRIGKTVDVGFVAPSPPPFVLLDTIENLVNSIPVEYALKEEVSEYDMSVRMITGTSLIEIVLKGPDKRTSNNLIDGVVEELLANHLSKTENIIKHYKVIIENLKLDIEEVQDDINEMQSTLVGIDADMEKEMSISVDNGISKDVGPYMLMMMQNKKIEILHGLKLDRIALRSFQNDIFIGQSTIYILEESKTRLVGEVENTVNKPRSERNIILAGTIGLMMSLFLAFFIGYLRSVREKEKDSV